MNFASRPLLFAFTLGLCSFAQATSLRFLAQTELPHKMKFQKTKIGGLSGAVWEGSHKKLWIVSDDRGKVDESRIYGFDFQWVSGKLTIQPSEVLLIEKERSWFRKTVYDLEGIVHRGANFILSSEGDLNKKPRVPPRIFELNPVTKAKVDFKIPADFLPELSGQQTKGIRNNSGFEGLSLSPSGKKLLAALERPLIQNSGKSEGTVPLLLFENDQVTKAYNYPLEQKIKAPGIIIDRGLSEVHFIDEDRILTLERATAVTSEKISFYCRIYELNLSNMKKKLVFDLSQLDSPYAFENFEAMTKIGDLLLVIADDNFKKSQKNAFLLFQMTSK